MKKLLATLLAVSAFCFTGGAANASNFVCMVNSNQSGGSYTLGSTGTHTYKLYNETGKHVSITVSFTY